MRQEKKTHILQQPNLPQNPVHLLIILALELVEHRVAVLAPVTTTESPGQHHRLLHPP